MSRQLIKGMTMLLLVMALAFVGAVASAYGQSNTASRANIPFEFVVGEKTLSAGQYEVTQAAPSGGVLKISGSGQSVFRLTMNMTSSKTAERSKLIFRRYGNRYFLAEIWKAGEHSGHQLLRSKEEAAIARELASIRSKTKSNRPDYERVEVALLSR